MSHNITMDGVRITNLDLLGNIAAELSKGTVTMVRNAKTFRTYRGQSNTCDHKLQYQNGPHDVGLVSDNKGGYTLKFDPYKMDPVFKVGDHMLGGLVQEYTLRTAEIAAWQQGLTTQREAGKNGAQILRVIAA